MARKETPDVLAALLAGGEPDAVPSPTVEAPAPPKRQPKPARPAAPAAQNVQWEYLVISLAQKNGWRPRYVNGKEVKNWSQAPVIHDFIAQMGEDGWEMVAAGAGKNLYGSSDGYHLFFKRILR